MRELRDLARSQARQAAKGARAPRPIGQAAVALRLAGCDGELNGLGDELRDVDACAADAEVEAAMQSEFTEASDASSSLDDLSDRNSPSSVMEIDSANWQGPDLRAGAHFFPDGKTRAY